VNLFDRPFQIAAVDPGGDTGLALLEIHPDTFLVKDWAVLSYEENPVSRLKKWREDSDLPAVLVYENFHVRPGFTVPDTTALEVIGGIAMWLREYPPSEDKEPWPYSMVISQEPAEAKWITDEILDRLGMKVRAKGSRHVHDALRHAVSWLTRKRYRPLCRIAWPRRFN